MNRQHWYRGALAVAMGEYDELIPEAIKLQQRLNNLRAAINGLSYLVGAEVQERHTYWYPARHIGGKVGTKIDGKHK